MDTTTTELGLSPNKKTAIESALMAIFGKSLEVDALIGLGYLLELANAFDSKKTQSQIAQEAGPDFKYGVNVIRRADHIKIQINGPMLSSDAPMCMMAPIIGMQSVSNALLSYRDDETVLGAIIEINSGGGESSAGTILKNAIIDFQKPVIGLAINACSAAYKGILPCKEIIATDNAAMIGSIGTMMSINREFIAYYKAVIEDIYSNKSPDKNEEFREYIEKDSKEKYLSLLDNVSGIFHEDVKKYRQLRFPDTTLTGKVFFAQDAKRRGLIDAIGTEIFALKRLKVYTS